MTVDIGDDPNTFGCRRCGCCCKIGFLIEIFPEDNVPEHLTETVFEDGKPIKAMKGSREVCVAFDEEKGCTIYNQRPTVCREFVPNNSSCQVARAMINHYYDD